VDPGNIQKGLEFPGGWGFYETKQFKEMYETQLEFPEGWGGMDILWNYTFNK